MPSTVSGFLLVVMMLPGFTYVVSRERFGVEKRSQGLRELVPLVAASVFSELAVLVLAWPVWSYALDEKRLVKSPREYFEAHPSLLSIWALVLLGMSTVLAFASAIPKVRRIRAIERIAGPYPHPSTASAWWELFEKYPRERRVRSAIYVGCTLEDGSYIDGIISSFNIAGDDAADRDLILLAPIRYRGVKSEILEDYPASAACISARRIVSMFVTYPEVNPQVQRLPVGSVTLPAAEEEAVGGPAPQYR